MISVRALCLATAMTLAGTASFAADKGNADEAIAMTKKAVLHYKEVGKEKALADFTDDKAAFSDRDLYVFCFNESDGLWTAHGANKALIGRNLLQVNDADGNLIGEEMISLVKAKSEGWVDYKWSNPTTKKVEAKSSFVQRVGDQICGVGIYK
jgi:cytochrome c